MNERVNRERMTVMRSMYDLVKRREKRKGVAEAYKLMMMLLEYGLNDVEPDPESDLYDDLISNKPVIDNSNKFTEFGKMGGRPREVPRNNPPLNPPLNPLRNPLNPPLLGVGVGEGVGEGVGGKGGVPLQEHPQKQTSSKRFSKPTVEEVAKYCEERGNGIQAQKFVDHYEAIGWVIGKSRTPMKDWRAAVRTWETRDRERAADDGQAQGQANTWDHSQRTFRERRPAEAE